MSYRTNFDYSQNEIECAESITNSALAVFIMDPNTNSDLNEDTELLHKTKEEYRRSDCNVFNCEERSLNGSNRCKEHVKCIECNKPIPSGRLEASPNAKHCLMCAREIEREKY